MMKCELLNCWNDFYMTGDNCAGLAVFMMASSERFLPLASEMAGRERDLARVHFPRPRQRRLRPR